MNLNVTDVPKFIIKEFENIGYNVKISVFNAINFGVPQSRSRLFFLGTRDNCAIKFPIPTHAGCAKSSVPLNMRSELEFYPQQNVNGAMPPVNIRDYISDLMEWDANRYVKEPMTTYQTIARMGSKELTNMEYKEFKASKLVLCALNTVPRLSGATLKNYPPEMQEILNSKNGLKKKSFSRMNWSKTSDCLTCTVHPIQSAVIHPSEHRILTVRESTRLQGFPDNFKFLDDKIPFCKSQKLKEKYQQIGNAVPVVFGYQFGLEIRKAFATPNKDDLENISKRLYALFYNTFQLVQQDTRSSFYKVLTEKDFEIPLELREGVTLPFKKEQILFQAEQLPELLKELKMKPTTSKSELEEEYSSSDDEIIVEDVEESDSF